MLKRTTALLALLMVPTGFFIIHPAAQSGGSVTIRVAETAGVRRTEYPLHAQVPLPQRSVADVGHVQLRANDAAVPAQYTVVSTWPDGSARSIDVVFNISMNPGEVRTYQLTYGANVTAAEPPARGLTVTESPDAIQIGTVKFNPTGNPLITSASYVRSEFIGSFAQARNGFAMVDKTGARHDLSSAESLKTEVVERGPLVAILRYSGRLPTDTGATVPFTLTVEMASSKSWMKMTAAVTDTTHRVRDLTIETPLALGAFPWQWDLSTENGSYGAFRAATDAMAFTQVIPIQGTGSWKIDAGTAPLLRPNEISTAAARRPTSRVGHLQGPATAVAFGIDGMGNATGTYAISLDGQGQATYRFSPGATDTSDRLVVYQHFVSTPIAVGAATSAVSMLKAPVVTVTAQTVPIPKPYP